MCIFLGLGRTGEWEQTWWIGEEGSGCRGEASSCLQVAAVTPEAAAVGAAAAAGLKVPCGIR